MFEKGDWVVLNGQAKKLLDPDQISALNTFEGMLVLYATKAEIRVALVDKYAELATMINRRYFVDTECNRIKLTERIVQLAHEIEVEVNKGTDEKGENR